MRSSSGQATVELVALLPCVVAALTLVWQLAVAGNAVWAAGSAARVAARAHALGEDPEAAARVRLPGRLERGLRVRVKPTDAVEVEVRIPSVLGLLKLGHASATSRFVPQRADLRSPA